MLLHWHYARRWLLASIASSMMRWQTSLPPLGAGTAVMIAAWNICHFTLKTQLGAERKVKRFTVIDWQIKQPASAGHRRPLIIAAWSFIVGRCARCRTHPAPPASPHVKSDKIELFIHIRRRRWFLPTLMPAEVAGLQRALSRCSARRFGTYHLLESAIRRMLADWKFVPARLVYFTVSLCQ